MLPTIDQCKKTVTGSLRYERKEHGYTQNALADAIKRDSSTVNGWEGNGGSISLADAWRVADVYGISLDQLAGRPRPSQTA